MTLRWWTRLSLISAIAGFVASGPPPDFERPTVEPPATLPDDFVVLPPVIESFETTELVTTETVPDPAQAPEVARAEETPATTP